MSLEKAYKDYGSKAQFYIVYIKEAHPVDGWSMPKNSRSGINVKQPKTMEEREEVGKTCREKLKLSIPFVVDDMKDTANSAYSGWPDRMYVIDKAGKIVFQGEPGPRGFVVSEMVDALKGVLKGK